MRFLHSQKAFMKKDCTRNAAAAVAQQHAGGGNDAVESAKEDATVAQASEVTAQKQKTEKKPKKSKRHSKK